MDHDTRTPDFETIIVGTGFAGLGMAIRLQKAGRKSFVLLERAQAIGGTWRENTYPGCACDIPAELYSFSFETAWDWSRDYPGQAEILAYLNHCADKYGLRPRIRFGAELVEARFDEAANLWRLELKDGQRMSCRILISAMGPLTKSAYPDLQGIERFEGVRFHSAEWDHSFDPAGKRIAVIGTGASAIQIVPQIAPKAAALHLFQRTPPWILPKDDHAVSAVQRWLRNYLPLQRRLHRLWIYWSHESAGFAFALYPKLMRFVERKARAHAAAQLADKALEARVTPSYRLGCKRVLISDDYYPALKRANVELVTDRIVEVGPRAIVTAEGAVRAVDAIVLATGFKATEFIAPVRIFGRGGVELSQGWRKGAEAYFGTTVAGYPNLFLLVGPNTGLGHNSLVFMIEAQLGYVMKCLEDMKARGAATIEVDADAQRRFNAELERRMRRTVWKTGCQSWYLDAGGKNTTLWPGFSIEFWWRLRRPKRGDYRYSVG